MRAILAAVLAAMLAAPVLAATSDEALGDLKKLRPGQKVKAPEAKSVKIYRAYSRKSWKSLKDAEWTACPSKAPDGKKSSLSDGDRTWTAYAKGEARHLCLAGRLIELPGAASKVTLSGDSKEAVVRGKEFYARVRAQDIGSGEPAKLEELAWLDASLFEGEPYNPIGLRLEPKTDLSGNAVTLALEVIEEEGWPLSRKWDKKVREEAYKWVLENSGDKDGRFKARLFTKETELATADADAITVGSGVELYNRRDRGGGPLRGTIRLLWARAHPKDKGEK